MTVITCCRPLEDALQFFSYFTNLEIQEELINKTIFLLNELGEETLDLNAKDVCREVYEEMFRNIQVLLNDNTSIKYCTYYLSFVMSEELVKLS